MQHKILTLFSRTPVHVGAGNSVGIVDLPIMRERHTRIPIIPGSSLKGVLRDLIERQENGSNLANRMFGRAVSDTQSEMKAGTLLIGEARVLAFPVRSAKNAFAWLTSPITLARFARDCGKETPELPELNEDECLAASQLTIGSENEKKKIILEEYTLKCKADPIDKVIELLKPCSDDPVWEQLTSHLAVVSDEMFSYFCEHTCEVAARICIDNQTGTVKSGALFYQENVPSETMFYSVIAEQQLGEEEVNGLDTLKTVLENTSTLQIGGDETIGLGCCTPHVMDV